MIYKNNELLAEFASFSVKIENQTTLVEHAIQNIKSQLP